MTQTDIFRFFNSFIFLIFFFNLTATSDSTANFSDVAVKILHLPFFLPRELDFLGPALGKGLNSSEDFGEGLIISCAPLVRGVEGDSVLSMFDVKLQGILQSVTAGSSLSIAKQQYNSSSQKNVVLICQIPDDKKPDTMFFNVKFKGYPLPTIEATS